MPGLATGSEYLMPASGRRADGRCGFRGIGQDFKIAARARQHLAEIGRDFRIDRLKVDYLIALDHAQMQRLSCSKPTIFMCKNSRNWREGWGGCLRPDGLFSRTQDFRQAEPRHSGTRLKGACPE